MDSDDFNANSVFLQTIKTNLTRENEFVRDSMISLTSQFKRYEIHSNIMMGIKKAISNLRVQLLQKDFSEGKALVIRNIFLLSMHVTIETLVPHIVVLGLRLAVH